MQLSVSSRETEPEDYKELAHANVEAKKPQDLHPTRWGIRTTIYLVSVQI